MNPVMTEIASVHNARVKEWTSLLERKGRQKLGQFLVEGPHLVEEALRSGANVATILVAQGFEVPASLAQAAGSAVEWVRVSPQVLVKCTDTESPQGIAAIVSVPAHDAEMLLEAEGALVVAVDGVQDPGNLGTIIRSADAVGASGVLLGRGTVDLYNPKTIRSTMGSLFHLPVAGGDLADLLPAAAARGVQVIGTSLQASGSCYDVDFRRPTWLVLGNESRGVSPEALRHVTQRVIIPMRGGTESLNVAMAATVLLFEASRQRAL